MNPEAPALLYSFSVEALKYAERGWPVFPVSPKSKRPYQGTHGFKDATTDPARIRSWGKRYPKASIAVSCGPAGWLVLDTDPRHGGDRSLQRLTDDHWLLPKTPCARTGGEGLHHYLNNPDGIRSGKLPGYPGLEVKAVGGYVIVPPSIHESGKSYQWHLSPFDVEVADAPGWLIDLCTQSTNAESDEGSAELAGLLANPASQGDRNRWLTQVAGHYARHFDRRGDYEHHVLGAAQLTDPRMDEPEAMKVADSIWSTEQQKFTQKVEQRKFTLRVNQEAQRQVRAESNGGADSASRRASGGAFILDEPAQAPAIWGEGERILWASGEPMMVTGPQSVGKTTLSQHLLLRRIGVLSGGFLGLPVERSDGRVLYIAADRPRQAARSFRRMVKERMRQSLDERLIVWQGPLPFDLGTCERGDLAEFISTFDEVSTVFVDALKDTAVGLTENEVGSRINSEYQLAIAEGYELFTDHHHRKATEGNKKPKKLADVYGSVWLTAGHGSVLLLWGEPGDIRIDAIHLKPPAEVVGPLSVRLDHHRGTMELATVKTDLVQVVADSENGLTVREVAEIIHGSDPIAAQIEGIRNKLNRKVREGSLARIDGEPVRYVRGSG